jgi:hypothetical protein
MRGLFILLLFPFVLCAQDRYVFQYPEMAGSLRLGIEKDGKSFWINPDRPPKYLNIATKPLKKTKGILISIRVEEETELYWAFGGGNLNATEVKPENAKDNIYSMERSSVAMYYGESMNLRILHAIFPLEASLRLADALQQDTPLQLWNSGKKTAYPLLAGKCTLKKGETYYICVYRQTPEADYLYYHLEDL